MEDGVTTAKSRKTAGQGVVVPARAEGLWPQSCAFHEFPQGGRRQISESRPQFAEGGQLQSVLWILKKTGSRNTCMSVSADSAFQYPTTLPQSLPGSAEACGLLFVSTTGQSLGFSALLPGKASSVNRLWRWVHAALPER